MGAGQQLFVSAETSIVARKWHCSWSSQHRQCATRASEKTATFKKATAVIYVPTLLFRWNWISGPVRRCVRVWIIKVPHSASQGKHVCVFFLKKVCSVYDLGLQKASSHWKRLPSALISLLFLFDLIRLQALCTPCMLNTNCPKWAYHY